MNSKQTFGILTILAVIITIIVCVRGFVIIDPGTVGVQVTMGTVNKTPLAPDWYVIKPWSDVNVYNVQDNDHKESIVIQTQDQLSTKIDVSIRYNLNGSMAPEILDKVGSPEKAFNVYVLSPFRSKVREELKTVANSEDLFTDSVQKTLQVKLLSEMQEVAGAKGINVTAIFIRNIQLPKVIQDGIDKKKRRDQLAEEQKAELARFATEEEQKIKTAESELSAAIIEAKQIRELASAEAFRIKSINDAIQNNPAYVQLKQIEAFVKLGENPNVQFTFINGGGNILPHLDIGKVAPVIKKK